MRKAVSLAAAVVLSGSGIALTHLSASAADNPVVVENQLPGSAAWRVGNLVSDDATGQIKGYASATSYNQGDTLTVFVTVNPAQAFTLDIYRIGWYGGLGGRLVSHQAGLPGVHQQACASDAQTGLIQCHWTPSLTTTIPSSWTSGMYLALLTNQLGYQNYVAFAVKDGRRAAYLFEEGVTTSEAYNDYPNDGVTGKSLYAYNSNGGITVGGDTRAVKVSFDRPFTRDGSGLFLTLDVQLVRWLEMSGYDVTYSTDVDTHANGAALLNSKAFLISGHDEYWSKQMYDNVTAARDAGVNLAFFGADAVSWQIRFEASDTGVPNRVIVCYKDATIDPVQGPTTTVRWRSTFLNRPEQTLIGVMSEGQVAYGNNAPYIVQNSSHWAYASTGFKDGDSASGIVGYEMDRLISNYPTPNSNNQTLLSWSPFINQNGSPDYSNSSIYQAPSGAWVFASGTLSWSWGLDPWDNIVGNPRIRQMTANILSAFVLGAPIAQSLSITGPPSANAGTPFGITVAAKNAQGNPATRYAGTVHFTSSDTSPGVVLPPDSTLTNGTGSFSVTLIKAGTQSLTATDAANNLTSTISITVAGAAATGLAIAPATTTPTAGVPFSFTVTAQDRFGNPDPSYARTVHFTTTDKSPGVVLPADSTLTGGKGTFSATLILAGPQSLTVSDSPGTFSATANLTVMAAPATHFVLATASSNVSAGTSFGFTIVALDTYGNVDTAYAGTVAFSSTDSSPGVLLPPGSKLSAGQGSFTATLVRSGSQTITATDSANSSINGSLNVTVSPSTATHFALTKTSSSPATAGASFTFTIAALDAYGNVDPSYSGTVHFASSDTMSGVALPANTTLVNGLATLSAILDRAGPQTITAGDTAQPSINGTMTVTVVAAAAASLRIDAPAKVAPNTPFAVQVTAFDQFGNVATGYGGTVRFSTSDSVATLLGKMPANYTFTPGDRGTHSFTTSLVTVGSQTISVIDTTNARLSATSQSILVSLV